MTTMADVYELSVRLDAAIEAARAAELPDTYEKLVEVKQHIVAEFKAVRAIKQAGGAYPPNRL